MPMNRKKKTIIKPMCGFEHALWHGVKCTKESGHKGRHGTR